MNKKLITIFFFFSLIANAQKMEKVDPIDISYMLSYEDFQEIKQFVLDKGQTRTYCNMYNNNPYYELKDSVELYLNPVIQFPKKEDAKKPDTYNTILIVIYNKKEDNSFRPIRIDIEADKTTKTVYLTSYWDTKESMKLKEDKFREYIHNILTEVKQ